LANETQQTIGDINEMFKTVFAELDEIFKITMSVDNANMVDLENTQAKTAEIVQRVRNVVEPDPTGGGPNKSRLMMAIDRLSTALQFKGNMPTDKTPMDLQKILDTVGKQDGAYITLFKLLEDTIYTGPECLTRKISGLITRLEAMEKVMQNRIDGEDKPDRDMVTEKGKENKNRDAIAKNVKANVGVVRSTLQQTQAMLKAIKPFTTEVIELDRLIGRVLVNLLKTMNKIYKDNGKQTNKFVELANKIANSLGYGNKMFS
jgi:methyl-accepting chemotaxis protein